MINLQTHADGILLLVRAHAGAKRSEVRDIQAGALRVSVTQAPEKGKANQAIIALLADALDLKRSQIELASGATNPQKKFLIRGIDRETLAARIAEAMET